MANPEIKNPNQPSFETYDHTQSSNVTDDHDGLIGLQGGHYEQPAQQFPDLASKDRLHDDAPHTAQLVDEVAAGRLDHGLPADADSAMVTHAVLPPKVISDAITHDILDDLDRNGWDGPVHQPSELEAARLEMQKKHYLKKIIPALGSGALVWAAWKFGIPAGTLSDSTRDNIAWVTGVGTSGIGYVFSTINANSPRRYQRAAQKELKKLQKQEQHISS